MSLEIVRLSKLPVPDTSQRNDSIDTVGKTNSIDEANTTADTTLTDSVNNQTLSEPSNTPDSTVEDYGQNSPSWYSFVT